MLIYVYIFKPWFRENMVSCRYSLKSVLEQCGCCSIFLMLLLLLSMLDGFKLEGILFDVKNGQSKKWLRKLLDGFKHVYNEKDHPKKEFGDGDGVQICFQWNHTFLVSCLRSDAGSNFLEHVEPILGNKTIRVLFGSFGERNWRETGQNPCAALGKWNIWSWNRWHTSSYFTLPG